MDIDNSRCRIMEEELAAFWPQWHVSKLLSGGDSCEVFEIFRDNLGVRTYSALKVLRTGSTGNDDIPEAFTNEIQIMEALRGAPNIVLVSAVKGGGRELLVDPALCIRNEDGSYTELGPPVSMIPLGAIFLISSIGISEECTSQYTWHSLTRLAMS